MTNFGAPQHGQQNHPPQPGQYGAGQYGQGQPQYGQGQYGQPQYGQPPYAAPWAGTGATAPDHSAAARAAGLKQMLIGGIVAFVGILISILTYAAASDGGHYVVAYGPAIFGVIAFVRGAVTYLKA